jgi:hypothetical protein
MATSFRRLIQTSDSQPHTTRAALTGLRKRGFAIDRSRTSKARSIGSLPAPRRPWRPKDHERGSIATTGGNVGCHSIRSRTATFVGRGRGDSRFARGPPQTPRTCPCGETGTRIRFGSGRPIGGPPNLGRLVAGSNPGRSTLYSQSRIVKLTNP